VVTAECGSEHDAVLPFSARGSGTSPCYPWRFDVIPSMDEGHGPACGTSSNLTGGAARISTDLST
jgi:hypothetical protein